MIDLSIETPLTFEEARTHRLLKSRNGGRGVAFSTLWKWHKHGFGGDADLKLEATKAGRPLVTTEEALLRFFDRINTAANSESSGAGSRHANHVLDAAGIK